MSEEAEQNRETLLKTELKAEFIFSLPAATPEEVQHRQLLKLVADKAVERLQPIMRAMIIEIIDAQSKHYIKPVIKE